MRTSESHQTGFSNAAKPRTFRMRAVACAMRSVAGKARIIRVRGKQKPAHARVFPHMVPKGGLDPHDLRRYHLKVVRLRNSRHRAMSMIVDMIRFADDHFPFGLSPSSAVPLFAASSCPRRKPQACRRPPRRSARLEYRMRGARRRSGCRRRRRLFGAGSQSRTASWRARHCHWPAPAWPPSPLGAGTEPSHRDHRPGAVHTGAVEIDAHRAC